MKSQILELITAIWRFGNRWLRRIILFAIGWPVAMLCAAMVLPAAVATTAIPILALLPLVAFFILVLQIPLVLAAATTVGFGRKVIASVAAILGVELVIGAYLALVPVSNDVGLVPLFVLSVLAVALLRLGKVRGGLTTLFALIVIVLTVVFLLGGRKGIGDLWASIERNLSESSPAGNGLLVCPDAWEQESRHVNDYRKRNPAYFDVALSRDDCFGATVYPPTAWQSWGVEFVSGEPDRRVSYWFYGQSPVGPFEPNGIPDFEHHPTAWRLKGKGTLRYFRTGGEVSPEPEAPVADAQQPATPETSPPGSAKEIDQVVFTLGRCEMEADNVDCGFQILSHRADRGLSIYCHEPRIIDPVGGEHPAARESFGAARLANCSGFYGWQVTNVAVKDIPLSASIGFEGVPPNATVIALLEIKSDVGKVQFRNIPIQK